jgi:predicted nuclease of predicted toxin-antitoxin system
LPKPPETPTFFLDRALGKNVFARLLRDAGLIVEVHDDHFPSDAPDEIWLREAGKRNWVVVTNDGRIRYRPIEVAALRASKVRVFAFTQGNLTAAEMGEVFLLAMPKILRTLRKNRGPFIASLSRHAEVTLLA